MADGEGLPALRSGCLPMGHLRLGASGSLRSARTANVDFGLRPSPLRGRPAVGLCRCAALFIPRGGFQAACGRWRMGRDSNPRCIAAHTLSKRAHSTTLPPIRKRSPEIKHGSASCCKLGSVFYESAPRNPVHRSQLRFAPPTCSCEQDFSVKPLRTSAY